MRCICSKRSDNADTENGDINNKTALSDKEKRLANLTDEEREIVAALAEKSYHLPGNTWCQDWWQYFANNHPILSLIFHDPLHPVGQGMRIIGLLGSVVFGLALTNIVFLFFIYDSDDADATVINISLGSVAVNNQTETLNILAENNRAREATQVQINTAMLLLWTLGGMLHALFDSTIWILASGMCCQAGSRLGFLLKPEHQKFGNYLVIIVVLLVTAISSLFAVLRVALNDEDGTVDVNQIHSAGLNDDVVDISQVKDVSNYEFLLSYSVELAFAWLLYFPLVETVFMSGILVCGKPVPFLGGRRYDMAVRERNRAKQQADIESGKGDSNGKEDGNKMNQSAKKGPKASHKREQALPDKKQKSKA